MKIYNLKFHSYSLYVACMYIVASERNKNLHFELKVGDGDHFISIKWYENWI